MCTQMRGRVRDTYDVDCLDLSFSRSSRSCTSRPDIVTCAMIRHCPMLHIVLRGIHEPLASQM